MSYRRVQLVVWATLGAYLLIGLSFGFRQQHKEVFPFFSWSLFSKVKTERLDFGILLLQVNGEELATPVDLMSARGVVKGAGSIRAYWALQEFAPALRSRNPQRYAPLRRTFETNYLAGPSQLTYAIVLRRWDPIERFRRGTIEQKEMIRVVRQ